MPTLGSGINIGVCLSIFEKNKVPFFDAFIDVKLNLKLDLKFLVMGGGKGGLHLLQGLHLFQTLE